MRLSDLGYRSALITGAGSGLGRAFADAFIDQGLHVWGTSRWPDRMAVRDGLIPVEMDLADPEGIDRLWSHLRVETGGIDIVVANAGFGVWGEFAGVPFERWADQIDAMLTGSARLLHRAMPDLRDRVPSAIVVVSSLAVDFPLPGLSGYNAVKSGLSGLARGLMIESDGRGPNILDFRPGDYRTSFNRAMELSANLEDSPEHLIRAGRRLDVLMEGAPDPQRAARDLVRALRRRRDGVFRSGSFFQARLAPTLARFLHASWLRAATRRYFGIS
ncbi:MAG: SDR family NAD(P)-dependent oxidoreductase [Opitutaceae bacterium]